MNLKEVATVCALLCSSAQMQCDKSAVQGMCGREEEPTSNTWQVLVSGLQLQLVQSCEVAKSQQQAIQLSHS